MINVQIQLANQLIYIMSTCNFPKKVTKVTYFN